MLCRRNECRGKVVSASVTKVDEAVLESIRYRIQELELRKDKMEQMAKTELETREKQRARIEKALEKLHRQKEKLHTLLETDVYSVETFLERSKALEKQKAELETELQACSADVAAESLTPEQALLWLQYVLDHFETADAEQKNKMLCRVIRRIEYSKTERMCCNKRHSDMQLHVVFL